MGSLQVTTARESSWGGGWGCTMGLGGTQVLWAGRQLLHTLNTHFPMHSRLRLSV